MSYYPLHLPCKVQIWLTSQKHNVSMLVNTIQSSWASSFVQRCSILLVWINKMREEQSPRQTEMLFPFPSQCSVYITTPTQPSQKLKHARQLISLEYLHSADSRSWRGPRRGTSSFFYAACLYKLKTNKQPTATKKKTHAHQILMFLFVSLHYGDCLHLGPAKLCLGHRYPLKRSPSTFQPVLVPPFLCWGVIAAWQKCIRGLPGCLWRTEHSKTRKKVASLLYSWSKSQKSLHSGLHQHFPRWRTISFPQLWKAGINWCTSSPEPGMRQQTHKHSTAQPGGRLQPSWASVRGKSTYSCHHGTAPQEGSSPEIPTDG